MANWQPTDLFVKEDGKMKRVWISATIDIPPTAPAVEPELNADEKRAFAMLEASRQWCLGIIARWKNTH